jgi:hypothetical protein
MAYDYTKPVSLRTHITRVRKLSEQVARDAEDLHLDTFSDDHEAWTEDIRRKTLQVRRMLDEMDKALAAPVKG